MAKFEDYKEDVPFLVEAGLVAIKQGDEESALNIFKAIGVLDPKNSVKKVGFGLIALHKMELNTAKKFLEEALKEDPDNYYAHSFLALCHLLVITQENASLLEKMESLKTGTEMALKLVEDGNAPEPAKKLATSLLDWEKELQEKGATITKGKNKS